MIASRLLLCGLLALCTSLSLAIRPRSNSLPNLGPRSQTSGTIGVKPQFNQISGATASVTFSRNNGGGIGNGRRNSLSVLGSGGLGISSPIKPISGSGGTGSLSIKGNGNSFGSNSLHTLGTTGPLSPTKAQTKPFSSGITGPPTPKTGGSFSSHIAPINKNGQQNKPSFGMDASSWSLSSATSPRSSLNQIPSPSDSRAPSRRGSFGIADEFEAWGGINPKTTPQLLRFDTWETRPINNHKLNQNCYYCTAAGLSGRDTNRMVQQTETMQQRTGSIPETLDLLKGDYPQASSFKFQNSDQMGNYLKERVPPGTAKKFGLGFQNSNGGPGHMVGLKVWQTTDGQVGAREVDFQKSPQNRFTQGSNQNNYRPSGTGPYDLIDLQPFSLDHSKRTTGSNVLLEEHPSKRFRNTDIGK